MRQRVSLALAIGATGPGVWLRFTSAHPPDVVAALVYGLAIVGAAFLLSWAAEVAQLDISAGLAIAVLAFIAVLPEYAVDMVFASKGGNAVQAFGTACKAPGASGESACSLALANMTGANRLLIGLGWSLVVFIAWHRARPSGARAARASRIREVRLERTHSVEVAYLALATAYSLLLPLKHSVTPIDALVLVGIFVAYTIRISRAPAQDPHLVGPAELLGRLPRRQRLVTVIGLFVISATVIVLCAEHFADALVGTGREFGISEFLLVQWLAPFASEAPELLIAGLYAWRLNTNAGLGTLVSSKVNQWTLLVGTLPVVFAIASGGLHGLPIDGHQREELFLTAAQSFFAVATLVTLSISTREALLLFSLFWAQFVIAAAVPDSFGGIELIAVGVAYVLLGAGILIRHRRLVRPLLRDGFRTPYPEMATIDGWTPEPS
jgi:cation:H+ antiporter